MVMNQIALVAEYAYRFNLAIPSIGVVLLLQIPQIVVLTLPMSLLAGILVATARMSVDSELIALSASGVSLVRLLVPVLKLGLLFVALTGLLYGAVVPRANYRVALKLFDLFKENVLVNVRPGEFNTRLVSGATFFIQGVANRSEGPLWEGVLYDTGPRPTGRRETFFARQVLPQVDEEARSITLVLADVVVHGWSPGTPTFDVRRFSRLHRPLPQPPLGRRSDVVDKSAREKTISELRAAIASEEAFSPAVARRIRIELHKRFAIPFACVVFAVLGLALGTSAHRSARSFAFVASLCVFLVYQQLFYVGERLAMAGTIPEWLSAWAGNLLFGGLGLLLLLHRVSEWNLLHLRRRLDRPWLRRRWWAGPRRVHLPRKAERRTRSGPSFFRLLDRYVLGVFLRVLGLVLAASILLYVQVTLFQLLDDILRNDVAVRVVLDLYWAYLPEILTYALPVSILISTIITISILTRTNEVAAMFLSGVSVYRVVLPVVLTSGVITAACSFIYDPWLPRSSARYDDLMDAVRGNPPRSTVMPLGKRWLAEPERRRFYTFDEYHVNPNVQFSGFSEIEMAESEFEPVRRSYARSATWSVNRLSLSEGWERTFQGANLDFTSFEERQIPFGEPTSYSGREWRKPKSMTSAELADYIGYRRAHGLETRDLEIELSNRRALPFVTLVMTGLALPFGFRVGKQGKAYGVGIAIVLAAVYWSSVVLATYLGKLGILPPCLAVWSPNVIFALIGTAAFLETRT